MHTCPVGSGNLVNLSPFERERKIRERLVDFFKSKTDGLTTTDIEKSTKISRKTLEKHLQLLVRENVIFMKQHGPTRVYYPYIYKILKSEHLPLKKNHIIWFDLIETDNGRFLQIKVKKKFKDKWEYQNAIQIPIMSLNEFKKIVGRFKVNK